MTAKFYFRGTNNFNELKLIKYKLLAPSKNHITKKYEKGLSVSDTFYIANFYKYVYKISGVEIAIGSDGEPVLDLNTIKFVKWIKK